MRMMIIVTLLFLSGGYIFLIFPRRRGKRPEMAVELIGVRFAHRGLHGGEVLENTMEAFALAVEAGHGIELDVRVSSDGVAVVSHDSTLFRVFGVSVYVAELTAEELAEYGVPSLAEVLRMVGGRVPLLVEIKGEREIGLRASSIPVCEAVCRELDGYEGVFCVESFHPGVLRWFRLNRPDVVRGQLSASKLESDLIGRAAVYLEQKLIPNFMSRPDFVAYGGKRTVPLRLCRAFGAMCFVWTVTDEEEMHKAEEYFDGVIFEGFSPSVAAVTCAEGSEE